MTTACLDVESPVEYGKKKLLDLGSKTFEHMKQESRIDKKDF